MFFGVAPLAAVSSDLVASLFMKPVGAVVHLRKGTVDRRLVAWLTVSAAPSAFLGVLLVRALGHGPHVQDAVKIFLGAALLLTIGSMIVKGWIAGRRERAARAAGLGGAQANPRVKIRPLLTVLIGVFGGLAVGMTSVGSGSLIMGMLLLAYPRLRASQLVGTDLVQAIPLVGAAALGHALFGDVRLAVAASLLIGAIPAVYAGAKLSSSGRNRFVRPVLAVVLLASALRLVGTPTAWVLAACAAWAAVGIAVVLWRRRGYGLLSSARSASAPDFAG
jgi:uncharacterized membrane protein YfcA